jgi:hypothetical protein
MQLANQVTVMGVALCHDKFRSCRCKRLLRYETARKRKEGRTEMKTEHSKANVALIAAILLSVDAYREFSGVNTYTRNQICRVCMYCSTNSPYSVGGDRIWMCLCSV